MIDIADILTPARIEINHEKLSKKRVFEALSQLGAGQSEPDAFYEGLIERERLGSTALGEGIALPHARLGRLSEPLGCFIKLNHAIDFDAPDDEPVDLIFGLFVPDDASGEHLAILATLAEIFSNPSVRDQIRQAQTPKMIYDAIIGFHHQKRA